MYSVTQRISAIKQPYGGYLPVKSFAKQTVSDGFVLNESENIQASLVGTAVDYLTRFMTGESAYDAFHISRLGASLIGKENTALQLIASIKGLDDLSITCACQLVGFDVCLRASTSAYRPVENILPDSATIENIRIMVNRSLVFFKHFGPAVHSEITFEGGYSSVVSSGDGDFATANTLWDFKVSKSSPTSKHTLQILMYYIMGLHSVHDYFNNILYLGFFNPRLNTVYVCPISSISKEVIKEIEDNVICYNAPPLSDMPIAVQPPAVEITGYNRFFSVTEVCNMSGQKKSDVYADIRSGNLVAHKKGNKYLISSDDYDDYVRLLMTRRVMSVVFLVITLGIVALLLYPLLSS